MTTIAEVKASYLEYLEHERRLSPNTIRAYRYDFNRLAKIDKPLEEITKEDVRKLVREMSKAGLSTFTIHRQMAAFTVFWRWMIMEKHLSENPFDGLRLPKKRQEIPMWLSVDQLRVFVSTPAPEPSLTMAWMLLGHLGLRRSELLGLLWEDVNLVDCTVIIRRTKTSRDRVMPIQERLLEAFHIYLGTFSETPSRYQFVCPGHDGNKWGFRAFADRFKEHLKACDLAGQGIHPHTLRHTFATQLIRAGVPISVVADLMGHVDIGTTRKYIHHDPQGLKEAMTKLPLNL